MSTTTKTNKDAPAPNRDLTQARQIRWPGDLYKTAEAVSREAGLHVSDVLRMAAREGMPSVEKRLTKSN